MAGTVILTMKTETTNIKNKQMNMKALLKKMLAAATVAPLMMSCLSNDGNSYAGFTSVETSSTAYANTTVGHLGFMSYGDWTLTLRSGSDWLTPSLTKGNGMAIYSMPLTFTMNTTGEGRTAEIYLEDTSGDANLSFGMGQYATRGDGSYGYAPLVKSVSGSDGSEIQIDYDSQCRPTKLVIKKGDTTYRDLAFTWGDSTLTVGGLQASLGSGFQPGELTSETDTVGLFSQSFYPTGANQVFSFIERKNLSAEYAVQSILMLNQTLSDPDGDWQIDSLRYLHHYSDGSEVREYMKLSYSDSENRQQSVDVNQLILGIEECNPYLLVGLFRSARSTKIISTAATDSGNYTVAATLNSDKSVNTLAVTDKSGQTATYTFAYHDNSLWQ